MASHSTVKRKVAVHVAYVGTGYKGLQFVREGSDGTAVEDILEQAMGSAGAILSTNLNHARRTSWSRSSRTDKGVHSLSTVIGLKMECTPTEFHDDPEGQRLSRNINAYLPPEVRVLSVQRAHKAFNARGHCKDRTYCYYLPPSALGLTGETEADEDILRRLNDCLVTFQGTHPFHNYTERRRYSEKALAKSALKRRPNKDRRSENANVRTFDTQKDGDFIADTSLAAKKMADPAQADREGFECGEDIESPTPRPKRPARSSFRFQWIEDGQERDKITAAHYRHFINASAAMVELTSEQGGPKCVVIMLQAASFMVFQIRHMVAMAICVASGRVSKDFLLASLRKQSRMSLPLAPPQLLVLQDSSFSPFPSNQDKVNPVVALSGLHLTLRQQGQSNRQEFEHAVLSPAIQEFLSSSIWADWMDKLSEDMHFDEALMDKFLDSHRSAIRQGPAESEVKVDQ